MDHNLLNMLLEMIKLVGVDILFVAVLGLALTPLALYRRAAFAVLKRNFVGYFSNPTGYVFLCLFVFLCSLAAFWPHEFFVSNLANLDQLNLWMPRIMLVFIPAITMSLWADEKRQGTDELLLTLPAGDFDIVMGKYLSAAAIFTVSLLFSQLSNFAVLVSLTLGDVDTGLFFTTYFGYWLVGLAMLAIGMVASFLTHNLTVGFILGLVFNSALVFLGFADTIIPSPALASSVERFSVEGKFDDFGRGVVSMSGVLYFVMLIVVGIYLSMVLIGRRHWSGGKDGQSLWGHYIVRIVAVVLAVFGMNMLLSAHDYIRKDLTIGQVSSLSPDTLRLLKKIGEESKQPIRIDAFISAQVPDEYVKTKYNLVSMLKELERQAGSRIEVRMHDNLEPFSAEAALADERFGIKKQTVISRSRGAVREEEFILGAAFTSGLEKVVVPFFGNGTPVEYELIRSIATVGSKGDRKRLGVVTTDAQMFGGFSFAGGQPRQIPKQLIVDELEKQYRVEEVDPSNPIDTGKYDVLLIVQPSSLGPQQLANVVAAIKAGQPAAIFEDPAPVIMGGVPGTNQEKPPQGMFGMGGPPPQKGDIRALWEALGIQPLGDQGARQKVPGVIVWQDYNPYPRFQLSGIGPELVFVREDAPGASNAFNPNIAAVSRFEELLLPFPGAIFEAAGADTEFTELLATGDSASGQIEVDTWIEKRNDRYQTAVARGKPTGRRYTLAAWIRSKVDEAAASADKKNDKADAKSEDKEKTKDGEKSTDADAAEKPKGINVIYVCDIDMLDSQFIVLRNQPDPENNFRFDNVPFVLNVIDAVAGDDRFLEIRKRKPRHSTLQAIEAATAKARAAELEDQRKFQAKFDEEEKKADEEANKQTQKLQDIVEDLQRQQREGKQVDPGELDAKIKSVQIIGETARRRAEVKKEKLRIERDRELERIRRERDQEVQQIQNDFKLWAALLPPIPPLLVGFVVWVRRRLREREGISRSRMKI